MGDVRDVLEPVAQARIGVFDLGVEIRDLELEFLHLRDLSGGVEPLLLERGNLFRDFVAAGLAALGFREILAPLAVEALEITQEIGDAALPHLLLHQLEVVAHKTEVEHRGNQLLKYRFSVCQYFSISVCQLTQEAEVLKY